MNRQEYAEQMKDLIATAETTYSDIGFNYVV